MSFFTSPDRLNKGYMSARASSIKKSNRSNSKSNSILQEVGKLESPKRFKEGSLTIPKNGEASKTYSRESKSVVNMRGASSSTRLPKTIHTI